MLERVFCNEKQVPLITQEYRTLRLTIGDFFNIWMKLLFSNGIL